MFNYYRKIKDAHISLTKYIRKFDTENTDFIKDLAGYKSPISKLFYYFLVVTLVFSFFIGFAILIAVLDVSEHLQVLYLMPFSLIIVSFVPSMCKKIVTKLFGTPTAKI